MGIIEAVRCGGLKSYIYGQVKWQNTDKSFKRKLTNINISEASNLHFLFAFDQIHMWYAITWELIYTICLVWA